MIVPVAKEPVSAAAAQPIDWGRCDNHSRAGCEAAKTLSARYGTSIAFHHANRNNSDLPEIDTFAVVARWCHNSLLAAMALLTIALVMSTM
jgi:hypothetical protein